MNATSKTLIWTLIAERRDALAELWLAALAAHADTRALTQDAQVRNQTRSFLEQLQQVVDHLPEHAGWEPAAGHPLLLQAREFVESRARAGGLATDATAFFMTLRTVLAKELLGMDGIMPAMLANSLLGLDDVLNRLVLVAQNAYSEARERIITQQSMSLVELSTPVIRLWDHVLLLPLIGVIDTVRARKFTEDLLASITRFEASVAILDVTGVPVFDTAVARHLMKTVDAAQLLGAHIVMTGISPEGALTLTKLGIKLPQVITRATLRSGVAEALGIIGKRVTAYHGVPA